MQYWLLKSEPEVFSIQHLQKSAGQKSGWDGVRNYQARNYMRDKMRIGDLFFFYHSNANPSGIVGIGKIVRESHPDPSQFNKKSKYYDPKASPEKPIWFMVEVEFVEEFSKILSLEEIKSHGKKLADLPLLNRSRLSVMPITKSQWQFLNQLASPR